MKELATLALVILPLGMTIIEILSADGMSAGSEQHDANGEYYPGSGREAHVARAEGASRTELRRSQPTHAPGAAAEHAVPGKPA